MVQSYSMLSTQSAIAALILIFAPVNQISGASLDSKTLDGSIGVSTTSGASAGGTASTLASTSTSGTSASSSATTTAQSIAQTISPINERNEKQIILVVPNESRPHRLIPASAVSSPSISSQSNNQIQPPVPVYSSPINVKANSIASADIVNGYGNGIVSGPLVNTADKLRRLEEYKRSPYYVPPFDEGLISLPEAQLQYEQTQFPKDLELFKQIAREGAERRGKFGSSVALVMKYGGKLISNFIRNRQEEKSIPGSIEPRGDFFNMVADLVQQGIDKSSIIKKERPYTKSNVDSNAFNIRVESLFNYFAKILTHSPLGLYLRWSQMQIHKDDPTNPRFGVHIVDEGADLFAQWRAMGYESSTFLGRRIVNLLRLFARSKLPSADDV